MKKSTLENNGSSEDICETWKGCSSKKNEQRSVPFNSIYSMSFGEKMGEKMRLGKVK